MKNISLIVIAFFGIGVLFYSFWIAPQEDRSTDSPQEKLGQMLIIGFEGTEFTPELEELLKEIRPGGVLILSRNIKGSIQVQKLISDLQEFALREIGHPLFVVVDQEGGEISRIPWAERSSQAGLFDKEEGYAVGEKRATQLREMGVTMNLAPVLDSVEKEDFLYGRSFQKEPLEAFPVLIGLIEGHESKGVIPVPKHFPGYGGITENPEHESVPSLKSVPNISLFTRLFKEHPVSFVMVSHVLYEDIDKEHPFPFSQSAMKFLKERLGNEVLVI